MRLPDGTILMHGSAPYDPKKAHEYYIRTRQLKGRKPGQLPVTSSSKRASTFTVQSKGKTVKLSAQQLQEQTAYAAERVNEIKQKLDKLTAELKKRMAEAKRSDSKVKKPVTAADKAKAARDAKQYRHKHKQSLKTKAKAASSKSKSSGSSSGHASNNSVTELKRTIADVQKNLASAVARQRALISAKKTG